MTYAIYFFCRIDNENVETLCDIISKVINVGATKIKLLLASHGGKVQAAHTAYEFLKKLPVPLSIYNLGVVDSAANIVYLAADERYAIGNSRFMIHEIIWSFDTPIETIKYDDLIWIANHLKLQNKLFLKILKKRTRIHKNQIRKDITKGNKTISSAEAVELGFVTKVIPESQVLDDSDIVNNNLMHYPSTTISL